jgi:hypothetical protein
VSRDAPATPISSSIVPWLSVRNSAEAIDIYKAGATQVNRVHDEHGWRLGRVVDPYGHHGEIGQPLGVALVKDDRPMRRQRFFESNA